MFYNNIYNNLYLLSNSIFNKYLPIYLFTNNHSIYLKLLFKCVSINDLNII